MLVIINYDVIIDHYELLFLIRKGVRYCRRIRVDSVAKVVRGYLTQSDLF